MKVDILRLGHRMRRDKRTTTHVGLAARALGANSMIFSGDDDPRVRRSIEDVVTNWGGDFRIEYREDWQKSISSYPGLKVHLTMYGLPVRVVIDEIRDRARAQGILVIVGGEKVPGKVYSMVEYNVSVTNQPHSEISSLAVFLDRLLEGRELEARFEGAERTIKPSAHGKELLTGDRDSS
jgi:tRNA (cytidine56-2'-O)-methyltransferase